MAKRVRNNRAKPRHIQAPHIRAPHLHLPRDRRARERITIQGHVDLPFLLLTVLLVLIGLVMLLSASYPTAYYDIKNVTKGNAFYFFQRQAMFAALGFVLMFIISRLNYQGLQGLAPLILVVAILTLIMVKVPGLGDSAGGANRWLKYPIRWQPSEAGKFALILFFSSRMAKRDQREPLSFSKRTLRGRFCNRLEAIGFLELIPYILVMMTIGLLLIIEPHMSATIQMLAIAAAILFAGGISVWWFVFGGAAAGIGLATIINATSYMSSRIAMWRDPWIDPQGKGFQAIQSLLAIGSGGLTGLGLGNSRQKFLYLPESQNDFIFSVVCEELGLIGATLILILFALLIVRGYWLAANARDRFGSLVIVGIVTLFAFQVFLNVAVVSNLFPVTGISMPFFSYGGTALIIQMAEMGLVLSISRQTVLSRETLEDPAAKKPEPGKAGTE